MIRGNVSSRAAPLPSHTTVRNFARTDFALMILIHTCLVGPPLRRLPVTTRPPLATCWTLHSSCTENCTFENEFEPTTDDYYSHHTPTTPATSTTPATTPTTPTTLAIQCQGQPRQRQVMLLATEHWQACLWWNLIMLMRLMMTIALLRFTLTHDVYDVDDDDCWWWWLLMILMMMMMLMNNYVDYACELWMMIARSWLTQTSLMTLMKTQIWKLRVPSHDVRSESQACLASQHLSKIYCKR